MSALSLRPRTTPSRPRPKNEHVPGAGAYSPKHTSIEKNMTNSGASMHSKASLTSGSMELVSKSTEKGVGPGSYNSHLHDSLAKRVAKNVEKMSRQNPGFGIALPS